MSHIHMCLVSDQPIPNLTTVMQLRPDRVVLMKTKQREAQAVRLHKAITSLGIGVEPSVTIDPFDVDNVVSTASAVLGRYVNGELTLNSTSGTKISSLGAFQAFRNAGKKVYYVNTEGDEILCFDHVVSRIPISSVISVRTYLASHGFDVTSVTEFPLRTDPELRRKMTMHMAKTAVRFPRMIPYLNFITTTAVHQGSVCILKNLADRRLFTLVQELRRLGAPISQDGATVRLEEPYVKPYLSGIWLEEYVYLMAKDARFDEVLHSVKGTWDTEGTRPDNEFDVLFLKKNRLFLASCKSGALKAKKGAAPGTLIKEILYELNALGDAALGIFGKKVLVSILPIESAEVRNRAKVLGVELIDCRSLLNLKERMQEWMNVRLSK